MRKQRCAASLAILLASSAVADVLACGDKFLVPSRGMRFELKPSVRQEASVLLYLESPSGPTDRFDRSSIGVALQKAGYRPTIAANLDELDRTLRGGTWDAVLLDLSSGSLDLAPAPGVPVVAFAVNAKPGDLARAKKRYATVLKAPTRGQAFVDAIDAAVAARRAAQAKASKRSS